MWNKEISMKSAKNSAIIGGSIHGKRNISYDLFQGQVFVLLFILDCKTSTVGQ